MEEEYSNYIKAFGNLDDYDKKEEIIKNLKDLMEVFYKINVDFNIPTKVLPVADNTSEYLTEIFNYILSLKEMSASTLKIIADNLYEEDINE